MAGSMKPAGRGAEVQRLLGPYCTSLREAEHGGGVRDLERAKAGERLRDPTGPVFHVEDDVVIARELGEGRGEGEEEQAVEGVPGGQAGLEGG